MAAAKHVSHSKAQYFPYSAYVKHPLRIMMFDSFSIQLGKHMCRLGLSIALAMSCSSLAQIPPLLRDLLHFVLEKTS